MSYGAQDATLHVCTGAPDRNGNTGTIACHSGMVGGAAQGGNGGAGIDGLIVDCHDCVSRLHHTTITTSSVQLVQALNATDSIFSGL